MKGKVIVITGGGIGIGASIARGFAAAGSAKIAILGRTQATLSATARDLEKDYPQTKVFTSIADVTSPTSVNAAFDIILRLFGHIDVCVSNAGYLSVPGLAARADLDDWWKAYETNVKGSLLIPQAFLSNAKEGSYLLHTSTSMGHAPAVESGASAYSSSKLAATKLFEYLALENPGVHIVNVQPGLIGTALALKHAPLDLDDGKASLLRRSMEMNSNERIC
jgi:NAD(P)-dependent dehydrogenase (short-subunit alcohol dehydrogenase family)